MLALQREAPSVMVMSEMSPPRQTNVLLRGAYNAPGERVDPGVPEELLGARPKDAPKNRLGLAMWLTNPGHPLTARVVVNFHGSDSQGQGEQADRVRKMVKIQEAENQNIMKRWA